VWVPVEQAACFMSLPKYTVMLYRISFSITTFVNSGQTPFIFFHYIHC
jgi:hypothetical protein